MCARRRSLHDRHLCHGSPKGQERLLGSAGPHGVVSLEWTTVEIKSFRQREQSQDKGKNCFLLPAVIIE